MITASRLKFLTTGLAALALAACSGSYGDYDDYAYDDSYGYYGNNQNMSGYGAAGYGMSGFGGSNCIPGAYSGGYSQDGLRTGPYGNPAVATGNVEFYGQKSRYGSWQQSSASSAGCMGGYWMVPTYQIVQPPPVAPQTTQQTVTTTILESCPDGQYRMDSGDCAIMITEETEQYVPPVTSSYPPISTVTEDWYNPIRK